MLRILFPILLLLGGCQTPSSAWIPWDPLDEIRVRELTEWLAKEGLLEEPDDLDWHLEFDPLALVPDDRFREAFSQLEASDERIQHCQLGSPGGSVVRMQFTPKVMSETTALGKAISCQHDPDLRKSLCEFRTELQFHLDDPEQVFRLDEDLDRSVALALMRLLEEGRYRDEASDFPITEWPAGWGAEHAGRYLSAAWEPKPYRFALTLPGCGCRHTLMLEYGSPRSQSEVIILGHETSCI